MPFLARRETLNLLPMLDGMTEYIESGNMTDYQDHYYPSEMAVDAQIQTFLINKDVDAFLKKFDSDWTEIQPGYHPGSTGV